MIFILVALATVFFYFYSDIQYILQAKSLMKLWRKQAHNSYKNYPNQQKEIKFCFHILSKTSRSFSTVIMQLGDDLRDVICVFYLCCRALDTLEDTPTNDESGKVEKLTNFVSLYLKEKRKIPVPEACKPEYFELCQNFGAVQEIYSTFDMKYQKVIDEVVSGMGKGMAVYLTKETDQLKDYNQYCYYVAGLVGLGLTRLFSASGTESNFQKIDSEKFDEISAENPLDHVHTISGLANAMGLCLQKVNITRDIQEDLTDQGRTFWCKEIYGEFNKNPWEFLKENNQKVGLKGLNKMVTDALQYVQFSIQYLNQVENQQNFNFCAIPQVMAIATLALCYNNPEVFQKVVKIKRSLTLRLFCITRDIQTVKTYYRSVAEEIIQKIPNDDPYRKVTKQYCEDIIVNCEKN